MERKQLGGYELQGVLGEGGMGTVYRALDPTLDRRAAVKVIRAQMLSDEGKERFLREARACSRINHPNIITVYAAGEEDGMPYMAMEFIDGRTLRELVKEGPIDWRTGVRWTVNLLDALARLHDEGIVHRDLKPENIMVTSDRAIKLMDFGLAHLSTQTAITEEGTTLGTVPYMSPEQVMGKPADTRSDIFSIATILHEMLTGDHPFRGEHPMAVMYSIKNETPKPIKLQSQDYPPGLQASLDRAFAKELDKRYQTAQEFRDDLSALLPDSSQIITAEGASTKRSLVIGVVAAVLVLALAFTGWKVVSGRRAEANRNAAMNHNEQGESYRASGDVVNAEREFREALMADPNYAGARYNLGMFAYARKEYAEADSMFREASRISPTYGAPRYMLGLMAEERDDTVAAEAHYRDAIAAEPRYYPAYNNLGALLLEHGRVEEARKILDAGLAQEPQTEDEAQVYAYIIKNRGKVALAEGDTTQAEEFFKRAARTIPDDAELQGLLESL